MDATEHERDWQRMAKVAMGLQGDDPVNWPHYADEAVKLIEEGEALRRQLAGAVEALRGVGHLLARHEVPSPPRPGLDADLKAALVVVRNALEGR